MVGLGEKKTEDSSLPKGKRKSRVDKKKREIAKPSQDSRDPNTLSNQNARTRARTKLNDSLKEHPPPTSD